MTLATGAMQPRQLTCSLHSPTPACRMQRAPCTAAQRMAPTNALKFSAWQPAPALLISGSRRSLLQPLLTTRSPAARPQLRLLVVRASSAAGAPQEGGEPKRGFVQQLTKSLRDFGFGKTSLVQGGVGLFVFSGIGATLMLISWARGGNLFSRGRGYNIRGVPVGSTLSVQPSLERVDVYVEMKEPSTVIPRNALIEANQSGLIAEPLIDITPQTPIPNWKANPLDDACEEEGQVVCHQGRIKGQPGVAMDDLVYLCTKLARQMDAAGIDKVLEAVDVVTQAVEDARPLLLRSIELADQVTPLLGELRQGDLVGNVEALTRSAAQAAADIHRLQGEVLTEENVEALRGSVKTLTKTLEHVEGISSDVGGLAGDSRVKANLKQLIEALSRLTTD